MPRLTKAEKAALKEAKKQEKIRQEIERMKEAKRQDLKRELAVQVLKRDEIDKNWRALMLHIKEPVFKQDIEIMWHVFERVYDKKDYFIELAMELMNVADDQFQRTVASFCDTIDKMINKFLTDLENMSRENNFRTNDLIKRADDETANIMTDHTAAETHLQLLLYHAHTTADTFVWTTRGENMVKEDEDRNTYANVRETLRSFLENNYNALWDEYKAVLKDYVQGTAENQKALRKLRQKENMMADIIASQGKKIALSDSVLKKLRLELAAYETGTKQAVFRERRDKHRNACFRMKKNMLNGIDKDVKQLAILVRVTDDTIEWLEKAYKKLDKILRMAALCRKFETQHEKVLPFGSYLPHSPAASRLNIRKQHSDDSLVLNALAATSGLTRLWHRMSKAELSKRALYREKMLLEEENAFILNKIQDFKENRIETEARMCTCQGASNFDKRISSLKTFHPTAVDGVLEINKLEKHNALF